MHKTIKYNNLVTKRKECTLCKEYGFKNQFATEYDTSEIGNWTTWANNLDADVIIIGQDYSNQEIFERDEGKIELNKLTDNSHPNEYSTRTNFYLRELTKRIGLDIGLPTETSIAKIFLTNSVLCLKSGAMNASIPQGVFKNCGSAFLLSLVELISPQVIITLGLTATKAVISAYKNKIENSSDLLNDSFAQVFKKSPIQISESDTLIFPVYHPSSLGRTNRQKIDIEKRNGWELQKEDWINIKEKITLPN